MVPECCFNYKKGRRGREGRRKASRSLTYKSMENIYIFSLFFAALVMSRHAVSVAQTEFIKLKEPTSCPHYPQQRDTALHFCHKNLADLQEICSDVPSC